MPKLSKNNETFNKAEAMKKHYHLNKETLTLKRKANYEMKKKRKKNMQKRLNYDHNKQKQYYERKKKQN